MLAISFSLKIIMACGSKGLTSPGGGGVLGQVSDRDAPHRPSTQNASRVKKGGRNYTFFPILMKNRGSKYDIFLIFAKI